MPIGFSSGVMMFDIEDMPFYKPPNKKKKKPSKVWTWVKAHFKRGKKGKVHKVKAHRRKR